MAGKGKNRVNTAEPATLCSPHKGEPHVSSNNQLDDVVKLLQTFITSVERYDQLRAFVDQNFHRVDTELFRMKEQHDATKKELDIMKIRATDAEKLCEMLKGENQKLVSELSATRDDVDEMEMTQRRQCLVISNIPEVQGKSDEDSFIEVCNTQLNMPTQITRQDIVNVSRIKGKDRSDVRSGRPTSMIIRFQNEKARNCVFMNKKKLKGSGKVISEFLTPKKSALLKECYDTIPGTFQDRSIWTHFGKVLVRKSGTSSTIREIKSSQDIQNFLSEHNLSVRETDTTT